MSTGMFDYARPPFTVPDLFTFGMPEQASPHIGYRPVAGTQTRQTRSTSPVNGQEFRGNQNASGIWGTGNPFRIGCLEEQIGQTNHEIINMNRSIGQTPLTTPIPDSGGSLQSETPPGISHQISTDPGLQVTTTAGSLGATINDCRTMGTLQFRTWNEYLGLFNEDESNLEKLWSSDLSKKDHVRVVLRRVE